jgi:hypothetical protein
MLSIVALVIQATYYCKQAVTVFVYKYKKKIKILDKPNIKLFVGFVFNIFKSQKLDLL